MAFQPTEFKNNVTPPGVSAEELNKIGGGVEAAHATIDEHKALRGDAHGGIVSPNDSRLSDPRPPFAHGHTLADLPVAFDAEASAQKLVRSDDSRLGGQGGARIATVKAYGASGSDARTTGTMAAASNVLDVLDASSYEVGHGVLVTAAMGSGAQEVSQLVLDPGTAAAGSITVFLNNVEFVIPIAAGDTATVAATKIRDRLYPLPSSPSGASYAKGGAALSLTITWTHPFRYPMRANFFVDYGTTGLTGTASVVAEGNYDKNLITRVTGKVGNTLTLRDAAAVAVSGVRVVHDDTEAVNAAISDLSAKGGGTLWFPRGTYNTGGSDGNQGIPVSCFQMKPNVKLWGEFGATLKYTPNPQAAFVLNVAGTVSGTSVNVLKTFEIEGLTFDGGLSETDWGFDERHHCLMVRDAFHGDVHGCVFRNIIGDGILFHYLQVPNADGTAYMPAIGARDVRVHHNRFFGTNDNRMAITVGCGRELVIEENYFNRIGRFNLPLMPGVIDLETDPNKNPNGTAANPPQGERAFLVDIRIHHNVLRNDDPAKNAQFGITLGNSSRGLCYGIEITDNFIEGPGFENGIGVGQGVSLAGDPPNFAAAGVPIGHQCLVSGNQIKNMSVGDGAGIKVVLASKVLIEHNEVYSCKRGIWLVNGEAHVSNNWLEECGLYGVVSDSSADSGSIRANRIVNAGFSGTASASAGIRTAGKFEITDNRIRSPRGGMNYGIFVNGATCYINENTIENAATADIGLNTAPHLFGPNQRIVGSLAAGSTNFPPSTGAWTNGTRQFHPSPPAGGVHSWMYSANATTPGWKSLGTVPNT